MRQLAAIEKWVAVDHGVWLDRGTDGKLHAVRIRALRPTASHYHALTICPSHCVCTTYKPKVGYAIQLDVRRTSYGRRWSGRVRIMSKFPVANVLWI